MATVALRSVRDSDLDAIFEQMRDPASVHMAAFTATDPDDRAAFDAHMNRIRSSPDCLLRVVTIGDDVVGTVGSFVADGTTEVTYWITRSWWGGGVASRALELLLLEVSVRPLRARVASDNAASLRVLATAGFERVGTESGYASARGTVIEEAILELT